MDVSLDAKISCGSLLLLCNVDESLLLSKAQKLLKNKAMTHASTEFLKL